MEGLNLLAPPWYDCLNESQEKGTKMFNLVMVNKWGNVVTLPFKTEHQAKQYARRLVARGVKVKGIVSTK